MNQKRSIVLAGGVGREKGHLLQHHYTSIQCNVIQRQGLGPYLSKIPLNLHHHYHFLFERFQMETIQKGGLGTQLCIFHTTTIITKV